ncbi:unnamed protein product [Penicillium salamii]|uniref:J domain-containing protein n=1 Tax=Penicillium salamii TaxID=1612424 RepID=A0A9W4IU46_9EURO|nr:unnamed protein product [Penicillium salamii]CAG8360395.1 unnamed protein product [Penicillium salamii]CAG8397291.1 unnamed protein product [Penicillium salamii]
MQFGFCSLYKLRFLRSQMRFNKPIDQYEYLKLFTLKSRRSALIMLTHPQISPRGRRLLLSGLSFGPQGVFLSSLQSTMADEDQDIFDSLEREASDFNKDAEIDRIRKAFTLDAYAVLDLQPGVPEKDIKIQYRKKSLLIHPDKTKNPAAPDAFDRLKKAQTALLDEKQRTYLDECIADARRLLIRELKYTVDSPELKTEEFKVEWRKKTVWVLLEEEARRRRQLKAQMQEEGREQRKEDEEIEARKRKREHDKKWEDTREERIGSWRDFQKERKTGDEKKKKKKMKVLG